MRDIVIVIVSIFTAIGVLTTFYCLYEYIKEYIKDKE